MLVFPLKKEWYEKIKSGEKTIEYREVKPYWSKRICSELSKEFERRFRSHCEFDVSCSDSWNGGHFVLCEKDAKLGYAVRLFEIKDASDKRLEPILKKLLDLKVIKGWYFNGTYHGEG